MSRQLLSSATETWRSGLRPRTTRAYQATFQLFLAVLIFLHIDCPWSEPAVLCYLEFLVKNGVGSATLQNNISVLAHYFNIYQWPSKVLYSRKVTLFIKSVKIHVPCPIKVKNVITIALLKDLVKVSDHSIFGYTVKALYLTAFFGFFRVATLVPNSMREFDITRYPVVKDVIWAAPGVHFIIKQSKTMQAMKEFRVAQLPSLNNSCICPVLALKRLVKKLKLQPSQPIFSYRQNGQLFPLTAAKVRYLLSEAICKCGLSPKDFGFHAFRRSGASLAFDLQIPLENIKSHGYWRSEAVWKYLACTPKAAGVVASTFQQKL